MRKLFILLLLLLSGCAHLQPKGHIEIIRFDRMPLVATTSAGQNISLGGLSSLSFVKTEGGKHYFEAVTDRGPNAEDYTYVDIVQKNARQFLLPEFAPLLVNFRVDPVAKSVEILSYRGFHNSDGSAMTGLPPVDAPDTEVAFDLANKKLIYKKAGMDAEGFCRIGEKLVVSEEYGPDLLVFNKEMKLEKRYGPQNALPTAFARRKINRGLEGLACDGKSAFVMLQSPLPHEKKLVRMIRFSIENGVTEKAYLYPVDLAEKIGDLTWVKEQKFLVLEQDGVLGPKGLRKIFEIDLSLADETGLLQKREVADLTALGFDFVEKVEGLALIDEKTLAFISDNDFGIELRPDEAGRVPEKKDPFTYMAIIRLP